MPTWIYSSKLRRVVKVSDDIPRIASRINIMGESIHCDPNGETLDFGTGPIRVEDAAEKRRVMKAHGVMPHPGGRFQTKDANAEGQGTFEEHFYKEHGIPLKECGGLVHMRDGDAVQE